MSNENKLIPELRFPEFENDGEWDKPKLSSVSDVIMGSSPSSLSYNENKIGLPLLQGNADIKNRLSTPRIYTTEITKECEIGDILLSVRAPVGTVAKSLHNACIGRGISALSAKKPNSQEYIYQWLFSYESSWAKISQGGTFDAVNSDDIKNLLVPIPKPKEQQKIASCLSSLDALITAQSEKIEQLKLHKKGLMQNLFPQEGEKVPKYRFKEFENDGEWQEKKLGDMSEIGRGKSKHRPRDESSLFGGIYPFIQTGDIRKANLYLTNYTQTYSEKGLKQSKLWDENTLCITIAANIAETAILKIKACFPDSVIGIIPKKGITDVLFINYLIENFKQQIQSFSQGMAQDNLNQEKLSNLIFLFPLIQEQQKIASCLSSLDALITAQSEKIEQLKLHKKGLMQGLFPKINE
jgi:type I restriction enzyme S subunit